MRSLGLYIHIPFCKAKCIYCDFYSLPRAEGQMDAYVSALTAQLAAWRERTADCTVDTVYFGGGTPSYLGPDRLRRLLDTVFQSYRVAPGAEITLEANPDSAQDISALRQLHDAGFDRLSLGMQSADDAELRRIGRVHTHAQTVRAVENARAALAGKPRRRARARARASFLLRAEGRGGHAALCAARALHAAGRRRAGGYVPLRGRASRAAGL